MMPGSIMVVARLTAPLTRRIALQHPCLLVGFSGGLQRFTAVPVRQLCNNHRPPPAGSSPSSGPRSGGAPSESDTAHRVVAKGTSIDIQKTELPSDVGDPAELPMERDPSVSSYSTGSADILGGGPMVNSVTAFSSAGFVVNERRLKGSVALLPQLRLLWKIGSVKDMTPESLRLFTLTSPKIELLVVGAGDRIEMLPRPVMLYLKEQGIAVELQATRRACSTYNFLSAEGRHVAAVLIPPSQQMG
eukprot:m.59136 g.59136  ORF g.59136 m.59136 type:complete len:246 (-) comp17305_c0_seq2:209-946(-)